MLEKIIYITGNNRSGSTVLDFLLGEHPFICSLGELHHLHKYTTVENKVCGAKGSASKKYICSCGKTVCECNFWLNAERFLGRKLQDVELILDSKKNLKKELNFSWLIKRKNLVILKKKLISKIINKKPMILKNKIIFDLSGYRKIACNHFELCEAVSLATSKPYIIDSSKIPHRFVYLSMLDREKTIIIHLVRNPVAVVYSMMKRGIDIDEAIKTWLQLERVINNLLKTISPDKKIFVRYEDLCEKPEKTLSLICNKINIKFNIKMINLTNAGKHHIQGSPSKYKYNGKIIFDRNYTSLSADKIKYVLERTLPFSYIYNYYN